MSGRSNPTVNNLRALFEQNRDSISPPSRGRSPAGSENATGDDLRPISKVRTSFVPVEWCGPMGSSNGVKNSNDNVNRNLGGDESDVTVNATPSKAPELNGDGLQNSPPKTDIKDNATTSQEKPLDEQVKGGESIFNEPKASLGNTTDSTSEKPDTETGAGAGGTQSSHSEKVDDNMAAPKSSDEPQDLGEILKGAPFEQVAEENAHAVESKEPVVPGSTPSSPKQASDSNPEVPNSRSKPAAIPRMPPTRDALSSSRPLDISTKKPVTKTPKAAMTAPTDIPGRSPQTPNSPPNITGSQAPTTKITSPRQPQPSRGPNNVNREAKKEVIPKPNRLSSGATKAPTTKADKGASLPIRNPVKKSDPTSPTTKPRPKSPTRPVRLPGAATASTASSAAKLGEAAPAKSASLTSVTNNSKASAPGKDRVSISSNARKTTARPSLSHQTSAIQKPKARLSTASTKAPEESFLARMMRPTQSSASKSHEKVEHAPTKSVPIKPKRKSGSSGEDAKGAGSEELLPAAPQSDDEHGSAPSVEKTGDMANGTDGALSDLTLAQ